MDSSLQMTQNYRKTSEMDFPECVDISQKNPEEKYLFILKLELCKVNVFFFVQKKTVRNWIAGIPLKVVSNGMRISDGSTFRWRGSEQKKTRNNHSVYDVEVV